MKPVTCPASSTVICKYSPSFRNVYIPEYCLPSFESFAGDAGAGEGAFEAEASPDFGAGFASCCAANDDGDNDSAAINAPVTITILLSSFMMALPPIPSYSRDGKARAG